MKILLIILISLSLHADTGTLIKIVDGDTLYFKTHNQKVKCRIEYIDTPESYQSNKLDKDISKCNISNKDMLSAGKSATRHAKSFLKLNKQYEYEVNGKDRYGRSICVVKLDDTTFNEKMVIDGYATIYREYMNQTELKYYEAILNKAKNNRVGLWKDRFETIECLNEVRR
ncbi:thermonuclease family protein [Sulfurimonas sp.]|nr:thermonuclease family protein [Sulfurimonas sp.]